MAMLKQLSPPAMVYSTGGMGVNVGSGVGVKVGVGVVVIVGVVVGDGTGVGSNTRPVDWRVKKTAAAPTVMNKANKPRATGRLRVSSGIFVPCTGLGVFEAMAAPNSVPQTTHLTAFSLTRVPHVGQIFDVDADLSGVISLFLMMTHYTSFITRPPLLKHDKIPPCRLEAFIIMSLFALKGVPIATLVPSREWRNTFLPIMMPWHTRLD